ncbi:hypothetical protein DFH11DRAFT_1746879 [Phellopilus nigrolimitatus]|nr:hypothetical protein DFH11DRAFT_1746879 [Phellopilus nigrolimitatus]
MAPRTTIQHILSGNMRKAHLCFDFILDLSTIALRGNSRALISKETRQATLHNSRSQLKEVPFVLLLDGPFQPVKLLEPENRRLPACDFDARRHRRDGESSRFVLGYQALAMRKVLSIEHIDTYRNSNQFDELVQKVPNYLPTSTLSLVYHLYGEVAEDGKMARTPQIIRLVRIRDTFSTMLMADGLWSRVIRTFTPPVKDGPSYHIP